MSVSVAIPFHGDRDLLRRCVRSILDQTHRDLRVLVVADGMKTGLRYRDSRLHVYELPENQGCYYARAVALAATDTEWHAVIDADDWADPEWLEQMLATGGTVVWNSARIDHKDGREPRELPYPRIGQPLTPILRHYTHHTGLYDTAELRSIGGYHPGYRIAYDTLVVGLLRLTGPTALLDKALYHRTVRPDSLMHGPDTRMGSARRHHAHVLRQRLWAHAWQHPEADAIRAHIEADWPDGAADEIAEHAARIR